jgi:hypothetical protein
MIVFCTTNGILISDTFGFSGSKELHAFAKRARLTRDHIRSEGSPVDEHFIVPPSKRDGMQARGAFVVGPADLRLYQEAKHTRSIHTPAATPAASPAKPMTPDFMPSDRFEVRRRERDRDRRRTMVA